MSLSPALLKMYSEILHFSMVFIAYYYGAFYLIFFSLVIVINFAVISFYQRFYFTLVNILLCVCVCVCGFSIVGFSIFFLLYLRCLILVLCGLQQVKIHVSNNLLMLVKVVFF